MARDFIGMPNGARPHRIADLWNFFLTGLM
jgi:hypothetical protein